MNTLECALCGWDITDAENSTEETLDDGTLIHRHEYCYDEDETTPPLPTGSK
jgi:hypothetical protein